MIRRDRPEAGTPRPRTGDTTCIVLMLAGSLAWLLVLATPLLRGAVFRPDDLAFFHLPLRSFIAETYRQGGDPTWCPDLFLGFDLHGEGQIGLAHPTRRLMYLALPVVTAFWFEVIAPMPLAALGTTFFLRRQRLPWAAAGLGGCVFGFGGYLVFHYVHPNSTAVAAHLPWLLLVSDLALRTKRAGTRRLSLAGSALLIGSMALLGHPQTLWYVLLAQGSYVVLMRGRASLAGRLACLAAASVLGAGLGGVQLAATSEAAAQSYRVDPGPEFSGLLSMHPLNLHQWVVPLLYRPRVVAPALPLAGFVTPAGTKLAEAHAREFGLYNGAIVPVAFVWMAMRGRSLRRRRPLIAWAALMIVGGLALAFGVYTPLFEVTSRTPVLNLFRAPARYVVLVHFASAVLVALAFADAMKLARRAAPARIALGWLAIPSLAGLMVAVLSRAAAARWPETLVAEALADPVWPALSLLLLAAVSVVLVCVARGTSWAPPVLVALTLADLAGHAAGHFFLEPPGTPEEIASPYQSPPMGDFERVFVAGQYNNLWMGSGRGIVGGYAALAPETRLDYSKPEAQRLAGVRWSVVNGTTEERRDALPFARLVTETLVSTADANQEIESIDLNRVALVQEAVPIEPGVAGRATVVAAEPGHTRLAVSAPTRQLLVLSERYHPGWAARVDGSPRTVRRVNADFLGCVVPAGDHDVDFHFEPSGRRFGARWSIASLAVTAVLACSGLWRNRREGASRCGSPGTRTAIIRASAAPRPTAGRWSRGSPSGATRSTS